MSEDRLTKLERRQARVEILLMQLLDSNAYLLSLVDETVFDDLVAEVKNFVERQGGPEH